MTYLSIDLDYWLAASWSDPVPLAGLFKLLRQVQNADWLVVDEHHHILDHLHQWNPSDILHVDYHTDVAFETDWYLRRGSRIELNCGTFFWFLKNRENMRYTWFYPEADCPRGEGLCMDKSFKPLARKQWIFREQRRKMGLPTRKQLAEVKAVGFAISRDYCYAEDEYLQRIMQVLRKRYIPKGAAWRVDHELKDLQEPLAPSCRQPEKVLDEELALA